MTDLKDSQLPKGRTVDFAQVWGGKKRIHRSGEKFGAALSEIARGLKGNVQLFTKQAALKTYAGIIENNPVDTGYSRVNWHFGTSQNLSIIPEIENAGKNSYPLPDIKQASSKAGVGWTYYLNNNLPYIAALEAGSSNQQPTGFIANTLFRVAKDIKNSKR